MYTALSTCGLGIAKSAAVEPMMGIINQLAALVAESLIAFLFAAI